MMRETDELLPTTARARKVETPRARPRALALTLAVALCAASAIAGVAIPRSSGDGVVVGASSLKAKPDAAPPAIAVDAKSSHAVTKSGLVRDVDSSDWARECLWYWQTLEAFPKDDNDVGKNDPEFSNYDLIGMPSGICTDTMSCAFENCNVSPFYLHAGALSALGAFDVKSGDINALAKENDISFNLPDQIAFPTCVKDVVDVVKHAHKQKKPVSVKTSGHSYAGSSTLAKSVNINLRDFPKYTQKPFLHSLAMGELPAVTPCDAAALASQGLEPPPACTLAAARGKSAVVRVGGGELWDDVYRGVEDANHWLKWAGLDAVEVMGGYAGTVSAVGGWMQGGGLSDGSERVYGFGADQVLELEMVLADGQHVKFGPSKWDPAPGYLYPKTTEVSGYCNTDVAAVETEWQWESCEVAVPWEDLWFAVRGGGGGSYGIVVAATYQLHKKRTFEIVGLDHATTMSPYTDACPKIEFVEAFPDWDPFLKYIKDVYNNTLPEGCKDVQDAFSNFFVDVLYDPAAVGITKEASLNCGNSGFAFIINEFQGLVCYDGAGNEVIEAWKNYWAAYNGLIPEKMQASWDSWVSGGITLPTGESACGMHSNPTQSIYETLTGDSSSSFYPVGHVRDIPTPVTQGMDWQWSALIPAAFFLQKNDDAHDLVTCPGARFHIMGGNASIAYDQMSPISSVQRMAGAQHDIAFSAEHFLPKIQAFYPKASSPDKIIGGNEYNHIGSDAFGPLKSDYTKYCPGNFTHAEREEKCVSAQEFTWGSDTLKKLEDIKTKVDPHSLFQCQKCVGFKGPV